VPAHKGNDGYGCRDGEEHPEEESQTMHLWLLVSIFHPWRKEGVYARMMDRGRMGYLDLLTIRMSQAP
jgi:hypothetical protein